MQLFCLHRATTLFTPFIIRVKIKYYSSYCTIMSFDLGFFIFHLKKIQKDAKTQTHALISAPFSATFKFGSNLEKSTRNSLTSQFFIFKTKLAFKMTLN